MNNFLCIDTSSRYLTVLAVKDGKRFLNYVPDCAMKHSVILMDEIDKTLKDACLTPDECEFFAAVTGPGSFTGIRIGIAAAKGLAFGTGKPLVSVTAFDLIAYNVTDENFYTVIDAAHGHYYVCGYGENRQITSKPRYLPESEVLKLNTKLYGFESLPLPDYIKLEAGECLYAAVTKGGKTTLDMHALYVRKSQAEEGRK